MDAASAQRVPQHRGVDDEYRFAEPVLGFIGQFHHDQVGPKLHDGIGIGITKITQGGSCRRLVYYGNRSVVGQSMRCSLATSYPASVEKRT